MDRQDHLGPGGQTAAMRDDGRSIGRRPTMVDVSRVAGVSLKTVSRVVRGEPNVSIATAARVRRAIDELGFRRNDVASSLRESQTSRTVGLIIQDVGNPFSASLHRAVETVCRSHGYFVIAGSTGMDPSVERALVNSLLERRVAGILLVSCSRDHSYLRKEIDLGVPIVFVDSPPRRLRADAVLIDNHNGAKAAVEHMIRYGHRAIALLGAGLDVFSMRGRYDGYLDALARAGVECDERLVHLGLNGEEAEARLSKLLRLERPPTGVFATNNRLTIGAIRAQAQAGRSVSLVGFDDFELADLLPVPVTVVAYGPDKLGRMAADLLFSRLAGEVGPVQTRILATEVIPRGSGELAPPVSH